MTSTSKHNSGEIISLITLIVAVFIGITTYVSSQFLKNTKNKIATNSLARESCDSPCGRCDSNGNDACPVENNAPADTQPSVDNSSQNQNPPPNDEMRNDRIQYPTPIDTTDYTNTYIQEQPYQEVPFNPPTESPQQNYNYQYAVATPIPEPQGFNFFGWTPPSFSFPSFNPLDWFSQNQQDTPTPQPPEPTVQNALPQYQQAWNSWTDFTKSAGWNGWPTSAPPTTFNPLTPLQQVEDWIGQVGQQIQPFFPTQTAKTNSIEIPTTPAPLTNGINPISETPLNEPKKGKFRGMPMYLMPSIASIPLAAPPLTPTSLPNKDIDNNSNNPAGSTTIAECVNKGGCSISLSDFSNIDAKQPIVACPQSATPQNQKGCHLLKNDGSDLTGLTKNDQKVCFTGKDNHSYCETPGGTGNVSVISNDKVINKFNVDDKGSYNFLNSNSGSGGNQSMAGGVIAAPQSSQEFAVQTRVIDTIKNSDQYKNSPFLQQIPLGDVGIAFLDKIGADPNLTKNGQLNLDLLQNMPADKFNSLIGNELSEIATPHGNAQKTYGDDPGKFKDSLEKKYEVGKYAPTDNGKINKLESQGYYSDKQKCIQSGGGQSVMRHSGDSCEVAGKDDKGKTVYKLFTQDEKTQLQETSQINQANQLSQGYYGSQKDCITNSGGIQELRLNGDSCDQIGTTKEGNPVYSLVTQDEKAKQQEEKNKQLAKQNELNRNANGYFSDGSKCQDAVDMAPGSAKCVPITDTSGNTFYQLVTQEDEKKQLAQLRQAQTASWDSCNESCSFSGRCVQDAGGMYTCVRTNASGQDLMTSLGQKGNPILNLFDNKSCGGRYQKACTVSGLPSSGDSQFTYTPLSDGGDYKAEIINYAQCTSGLKYNSTIHICLPDASVEKATATMSYISQESKDHKLNLGQVEAIIQNNFKDDKDVYTAFAQIKNVACGTCDGSCVYADSQQGFSCVEAGALTSGYQFADKYGQAGELNGKCNSLFGTGLFSGCNHNDLSCNNNTCQMTDGAKELAAQNVAVQKGLINKDDGLKFNLSYLTTNQAANLIGDKGLVSGAKVCAGGNVSFQNGSCWRCAGDNEFESAPGLACSNPQLAEVLKQPGSNCRSGGGYCSDAGNGNGQSDCPGGFSCAQNPPPEPTPTANDESTGKLLILPGLGGDCGSNIGRCATGLRCSVDDNKCHDVTQLAYNENFQKGALALGLEKIPLVGGWLGGASTAIGGMFGGDLLKSAQIREKNFEKIVDNINTKYGDSKIGVDLKLGLLNSLDDAAKGQLIKRELSKQQFTPSLSFNSSDLKNVALSAVAAPWLVPAMIADKITGGRVSNMAMQVGADMGTIVSSYHGSTNSNPFVEYGQSYGNDNGKAALAALKMGFGTGLAVADVATLGLTGLTKNVGNAAIRQSVKIGGKDAGLTALVQSAKLAGEEGGFKGFIASAKTFVPNLPRAVAVSTLNNGGKILEATNLPHELTEKAAEYMVEKAPVLKTIEAIASAPILAGVVGTQKAVGAGVAAAKMLTGKLVGESEKIAQEVALDAIKGAVQGSVNIADKTVASELQKTAFEKAQLFEKFKGTESQFGTVFQKALKKPPTAFIDGTYGSETNRLVGEILQKGDANLSGAKKDAAILSLAQQQVDARGIPLSQAISEVKGTHQAIGFGKQWGFNLNNPDEIRGLAKGLTELSKNETPLVREQAIRLFTDHFPEKAAAKARLAVDGLLYDNTSHIIQIDSLLQGVSGDLAKKLETVKSKPEFQDMFTQGKFKQLKRDFPNLAKVGKNVGSSLTDEEVATLQKQLIKNNAIDPLKVNPNFRNSTFENEIRRIFEKEPALQKQKFQDINDVAAAIIDNKYQKLYSPNNIAFAKAYADQMIKDGVVDLGVKTAKNKGTSLSDLWNGVKERLGIGKKTATTVEETAGKKIPEVKNEGKKNPGIEKKAKTTAKKVANSTEYEIKASDGSPLSIAADKKITKVEYSSNYQDGAFPAVSDLGGSDLNGLQKKIDDAYRLLNDHVQRQSSSNPIVNQGISITLDDGTVHTFTFKPNDPKITVGQKANQVSKLSTNAQTETKSSLQVKPAAEKTNNGGQAIVQPQVGERVVQKPAQQQVVKTAQPVNQGTLETIIDRLYSEVRPYFSKKPIESQINSVAMRLGAEFPLEMPKNGAFFREVIDKGGKRSSIVVRPSGGEVFVDGVKITKEAILTKGTSHVRISQEGQKPIEFIFQGTEKRFGTNRVYVGGQVIKGDLFINPSKVKEINYKTASNSVKGTGSIGFMRDVRSDSTSRLVALSDDVTVTASKAKKSISLKKGQEIVPTNGMAIDLGNEVFTFRRSWSGAEFLTGSGEPIKIKGSDGFFGINWLRDPLGPSGARIWQKKVELQAIDQAALGLEAVKNKVPLLPAVENTIVRLADHPGFTEGIPKAIWKDGEIKLNDAGIPVFTQGGTQYKLQNGTAFKFKDANNKDIRISVKVQPDGSMVLVNENTSKGLQFKPGMNSGGPVDDRIKLLNASDVIQYKTPNGDVRYEVVGADQTGKKMVPIPTPSFDQLFQNMQPAQQVLEVGKGPQNGISLTKQDGKIVMEVTPEGPNTQVFVNGKKIAGYTTPLESGDTVRVSNGAAQKEITYKYPVDSTVSTSQRYAVVDVKDIAKVDSIRAEQTLVEQPKTLAPMKINGTPNGLNEYDTYGENLAAHQKNNRLATFFQKDESIDSQTVSHEFPDLSYEGHKKTIDEINVFLDGKVLVDRTVPDLKSYIQSAAHNGALIVSRDGNRNIVGLSIARIDGSVDMIVGKTSAMQSSIKSALEKSMSASLKNSNDADIIKELAKVKQIQNATQPVERTNILPITFASADKTIGNVAIDSLPDVVKEIRARITNEYGESILGDIYFFGGSARDIIFEQKLGARFSDIDLGLAKDFPVEIQVGIKRIVDNVFVNHGSDYTVDLLTGEDAFFTTMMKEKGYKDVFEMLRRDPEFSMNKMGVSLNGTVIDPHNGIKDYQDGVLRLVGDNLPQRFNQADKNNYDILWRGARFMGQYDLKPTVETLDMLQKTLKLNRSEMRAGMVGSLGGSSMSSGFPKEYMKLVNKAADGEHAYKALNDLGMADDVDRAIQYTNSLARDRQNGIGGRELRTLTDIKQGSNLPIFGTFSTDARFTGIDYMPSQATVIDNVKNFFSDLDLGRWYLQGKAQSLLDEAKNSIAGLFSGKKAVPTAEQIAQKQAEETMLADSAKAQKVNDINRTISEINKSEWPITPIKPGEVFDAETELKNFLKLPKAEREQALATIKDKLTYQYKGIAEMEDDLITKLSDNPNLTKEELGKSVEKYSEKYGFNSKQLSNARTAIDSYLLNNEKVKQLRIEFPDDYELFSFITSSKPKGNITITSKPGYFEIKTDVEDDIAIFNSINKNELLPYGVSKTITVKRYGDVNVVVLDTKKIAEHTGLVEELSLDGVSNHEKRHMITKAIGTQQRESYHSGVSTDTLSSVARNNIEMNAKSELLSQLTDKSNHSSIKFELTGDFRNYDFINNELSIINELSFIKAEDKTALSKLVASKEEYARLDNLINNGLDSYTKLIQGGYSKEQALNLLTNIPLNKWGKAADRALSLSQKQLDKGVGQQSNLLDRTRTFLADLFSGKRTVSTSEQIAQKQAEEAALEMQIADANKRWREKLVQQGIEIPIFSAEADKIAKENILFRIERSLMYIPGLGPGGVMNRKTGKIFINPFNPPIQQMNSRLHELSHRIRYEKIKALANKYFDPKNPKILDAFFINSIDEIITYDQSTRMQKLLMGSSVSDSFINQLLINKNYILDSVNVVLQSPRLATNDLSTVERLQRIRENALKNYGISLTASQEARDMLYQGIFKAQRKIYDISDSILGTLFKEK